MSDPTKLRTTRSILPEETAALLRRLAEKADRGEIIAVTVISEYPNGCYGIGGSRTLSRLQTMGALLDAAIMRSQE
ncbi:hypothetical protein ASD78_12220 [Lysobacter sp. Root667]|uniref:hypothetical protein n=1 Tax=Lysobacter sp. Root667 TaxID=1736581 RepID=UPI0006FF6044|nr:hypothetical protein [Lysobacter sp. Root667]KRA74252.1 hypothetical protein ASD78_12220 [Lysobacter sp. Root667]